MLILPYLIGAVFILGGVVLLSVALFFVRSLRSSAGTMGVMLVALGVFIIGGYHALVW